MNIVFLTSESPHHYFLINEINKLYPVKKVFFQAPGNTVGSTPWDKIKRLLKLGSFSLFINRYVKSFLLAPERKLEEWFEKRTFFGKAEPSFNPSIPCERVASFNAPDAVEKVKREEPDLVI